MPSPAPFTLIPAIDLIDGKCVRLTQGDYSQKKIYNEDPLEVALQFQDAGLQRLHLVDLDGARERRVRNWKALEAIASKTQLTLDFGGGITRDEDLRIIFDSGARYATVGSLAAKEPDLFRVWLHQHGADRFFLGADVKGEQIAVHGWTETTALEVFPFIRSVIEQGLNYIFCTDVSRDGLLQGPSQALYQKILETCPGIRLIASGGVRSLADLENLRALGCAGAIVGKAIYEGLLSLKDLKAFIS